MSDPDDLPRADFDARLKALNERRAQETVRDETTGSKEGWGQGIKISSEFVAAVAVGTLIGYGLDLSLDTWPAFFVVFFLLGFAAAVLNVLRAIGYVAPSKLNVRDIDAARGDGRSDGGDDTRA